MALGSRGHGRLMKPYLPATFLALIGLTSHVTAYTDSTPESLCHSLASKLPYENLTATYLPAGSVFTVPASERIGCDYMTAESYTTQGNICRVQVTIPTSSRSRVKVETWLPDAIDWRGRFISLGNGGLSGCFYYDELNKQASQNGMATVQTDNGHTGDTAVPMLNNEDVLIDFASRSLEVEYHVGTAITEAYYSRKPDYKYYSGCSMGGRQGFYLAQEYPDFYDGIIAGAPALDFIALAGYFGKLGKLMGVKTISDATTDFVIGVEDLPLITKGVLDQCDGKGWDGPKDGIIDNPDKCNFKAEKIQCSKKQLERNTTGVCLTPEQVAVVKEMFVPLRGKNGEVVYPRWDPGFTSSIPYAIGYNLAWYYGVSIFQNIIYNDTSFRIEDFTDDDAEFARKLNPANLATWNTDLTPFKKSGGKLLSYHGTADGIIPSGISLRYYSEVKKTISPHNPNTFWKHFVIPGMDHCSGSTGGSNAPWNFGQMSAPISGLKNDSDHNILWSLVEWVEGQKKSKGPETIIGTKFIDDVNEKGVLEQRTYCVYPKRSVLRKKGADPKKAHSWKCV